ncbi:MAG: penicillin-insensitive murein endopeptidase [Myxococcota bacterium]
MGLFAPFLLGAAPAALQHDASVFPVAQAAVGHEAPPPPAPPEDIPDWRVPADARKARSVGRPNKGRLENGVPLPMSGLGYTRFDRDSHFGTDETIALIEYAAARLAYAFPGTAPMLVGAISKEDGGAIPNHRSHRSGRDVDIAFFENGNTSRRLFNTDMTTGDVDLVKAWYVLETLMLTGRVEYIFADRSLHAGLSAQAEAAGWGPDELDAFFLLEDESGYRGMIRHAGGHLDHFHVRFRCPEGDSGCESY